MEHTVQYCTTALPLGPAWDPSQLPPCRLALRLRVSTAAPAKNVPEAASTFALLCIARILLGAGNQRLLLKQQGRLERKVRFRIVQQRSCTAVSMGLLSFILAYSFHPH